MMRFANETVEIWVNELLATHGAKDVKDIPIEIILAEIKETKGTISNERLWEKGYNGNEPYNPHTENLSILMEYLEFLEEQL